MLESATKVYGVPIIMSDSHYKLLSLRAKERMRKMDVVKCMDKVYARRLPASASAEVGTQIRQNVQTWPQCEHRNKTNTEQCNFENM